MKKLKHFYNTADFSQKEIMSLIDLALKMKKGTVKNKISGKTLALLFFNPSLRTRVSFIVAMQKLGGLAIDLPIKDSTYTLEFSKNAVMNQGTIEHVKDAAQVLSRYCDAIAVRAADLITSGKESVDVPSWSVLRKDKIISSIMEYATVPVVNMESNVYHPCQGLGDGLTIKEKLGQPKGKKYVLSWVYHPKALPMATPNSQLLAACDLGMKVVVAHPRGWELDSKIVDTIKLRAKKAGGTFSINYSQKEACKDAQIVCAKSWGALSYYNNWDKEKKLKEQLKDWIVDADLMKTTNNALFMHCLPVRRNVEVTDEVIDGKNSVIIDEAENRMWTQMAILTYLLGRKI